MDEIKINISIFSGEKIMREQSIFSGEKIMREQSIFYFRDLREEERRALRRDFCFLATPL